MMRNPFKLSAEDAPYKAKLQDVLVDDLYRRATVPVLLFFVILYVFYIVLEDAIRLRPLIGWLFAWIFVISVARVLTVVFVGRIRAINPDPRVRLRIFAVIAALLGTSLAAINIVAAPVATVDELALIAIIAAGVNSIAIVSMSPSLGSYLLYMVPNIGSVAIAVLIGPKFAYDHVLLFLTILNLLSMVIMATYVHLKSRRSILLRFQVDERNRELQHLNRQLESEIEERLAVEAALEQRNAELEAVNLKLAGAQTQLVQSEKMASVGQLAAGVAHEINNPIAFVRSNLNSLDGYVKDMVSVVDAYEEADTVPAGAARRRLDEVRKSVNMPFLREDIPALLTESSDGLTRVEKIVRDLKEFTHLDEAEWQSVDIHEGLESTLNVAAHQIRPKADVVRNYGSLPLVRCLPAQINQVFLNLLINAAQAHEERGTITITTGRDGDFVWIRIADAGKGISPAHLRRIFDPFFTTKPIGVGPGLGLSVSYSIVQNHGGTIDVESEPGRGSAFTVRLPIHAKSAD